MGSISHSHTQLRLNFIMLRFGFLLSTLAVASLAQGPPGSSGTGGPSNSGGGAGGAGSGPGGPFGGNPSFPGSNPFFTGGPNPGGPFPGQGGPFPGQGGQFQGSPYAAPTKPAMDPMIDGHDDDDGR